MTRRSRPSRSTLAIAIFAVAALFSIGCGSIPKTSLSELPDGPPLTHPNDSLFAHVLERAVLPGGAINLPELEGDTELTAYLHEIARVRTDVFTSRQSLLAFWINAHNAYMLDLLRMNQPVSSIGDLSGYKVSHVLLIGGKRLSLDEIETHILTHDFREPRAFFALADGSRSSPELRAEPYVEGKLNDQLNDQVTTFLSDSTKNFVDPRANKLYLSDIFRRYSEEFDRWVGGTARFIREFAPDPMAAWLDRHANPSISYLRYDETLSATPIPQHGEHPAGKPKTPQHRKSSGGIN